MFREKRKRSALGGKRYKKRKNSSPCVRIRKRGEKRAPKLFLSRTHAPGRRQLARAQHRATLLLVFPSFVFVASFFTHVCMCVVVVVVRMCFKKRRFFSIFKLFFFARNRQKKIHPSCRDERKNDQSFPPPKKKSPRKNIKKRNDVSLLF